MIVTQNNPESLEGIVRQLVTLDYVDSIYMNVNLSEGAFTLGHENILLYGVPTLEEKLLGLNFNISPLSFFQINNYQIENLYKNIVDLIREKKSSLLELYSGTGTLSILLSGKFENITAVELNSDAVRDAKTNAEANGIENIDFIRKDSSKYMANIPEGTFDSILINPPRKGTTKEILSDIIKKGFKEYTEYREPYPRILTH